LRLAAADAAGSARREGRAAIPGAMDSWPTLAVPGDRARPRAGESVPGAFGVAGDAGPRTAG
jgi:hypothetical protein